MAWVQVANLNALASRFGGTALHGATVRGHVSIVKDLLQAGASPSQADFNLVTPLHTAVRIGNVDVIKLLLDLGHRRKRLISLVRRHMVGPLRQGKSYPKDY